MALRLVVSQVLQILLKLWGVDTAARLAGRDNSVDEFARATVQRVHARNGIRVSIAPRSIRHPD